MIYGLLAAILVLAVRYTRAVKRESRRVLLELPAAALAGLVAGVWFGLAARGAMRVIALAAKSPLRLSASGSIQVVLVFAAIGAGVGLLYAGLFRHALATSGLRFGLLLLLVTWYPLAQAGAQLLGYEPDPLKLILISGAVLALMWLPYALLLQKLTPPISRRFA
jgi:hypothetical protein